MKKLVCAIIVVILLLSSFAIAWFFDDGLVNGFTGRTVESVDNSGGFFEGLVDGFTGWFSFVNFKKTLQFVKPSNTLFFSAKPTENKQEEVRPYGLCNQNAFKMAFILLVRNPLEATPERLDKLNKIKDDFPEKFKYATSGLASMDTSYKVVTVLDDGTVWRADRDRPSLSKVTTKFYEHHPDDFDFITIFNSFPTKATESLHENVVRNINGIGAWANDYNNAAGLIASGSKGRLGGINYLRNIDEFGLESDPRKPQPYNLLLHETGHQWCCRAGDNFAAGQGNPKPKLEIINNEGIHFYRGLSTPHKEDSLGANLWLPNGDGTYRTNEPIFNTPGKYHPFQLYFMGLLNKRNYDFNKKFMVYDDDTGKKEYRDFFKRAVPYKGVSINDIIAVEGERTCDEIPFSLLEDTSWMNS